MIIYKTTNLVNSKIYIGYDTKNNPKYLGSGADFKKALKELNKENFVKIIIDYADNLKDLCLKERFWIKSYRDQGFELYNIADGGEGGDTLSKHPNRTEICRRTRATLSDGRMAGEKNGMYATHHSKETKAKIGKARAGQHHSEETLEKMREAQKGEKHHKHGMHLSEEHKQKIAESMKRRRRLVEQVA